MPSPVRPAPRMLMLNRHMLITANFPLRPSGGALYSNCLISTHQNHVTTKVEGLVSCQRSSSQMSDHCDERGTGVRQGKKSQKSLVAACAN